MAMQGAQADFLWEVIGCEDRLEPYLREFDARQQTCNSTKRVDFVKPKGAAGKQDGLQQLALTLARSCK